LILPFLQQNCIQAIRQVLQQRADIKKESDGDDDKDFDDNNNNNNKRNEQ